MEPKGLELVWQDRDEFQQQAIQFTSGSFLKVRHLSRVVEDSDLNEVFVGALKAKHSQIFISSSFDH